MSSKRIISQTPTRSTEQLDIFVLLGETQAVVDATGERLVRPGKVVQPHAKGPASLDAQIKRPGSAIGALNLGKSGAAFPHAGAARNALTVAPAKYGNRPVIRRRD